MTQATGPLAGVRVIDITTVVLGPMCAQTLGDMGADVIKVETLQGDSTRLIGPSRTPTWPMWPPNVSSEPIVTLTEVLGWPLAW